MESAFVSAKTFGNCLTRIRSKNVPFFTPKSIRIPLLDWWKKDPNSNFVSLIESIIRRSLIDSVHQSAFRMTQIWKSFVDETSLILLTITQSIFTFNYSLERIFSSWNSSLNIDERQKSSYRFHVKTISEQSVFRIHMSDCGDGGEKKFMNFLRLDGWRNKNRNEYVSVDKSCSSCECQNNLLTFDDFLLK